MILHGLSVKIDLMFNENHTVLGIVAHVDAGKTTLSEGLLYESGALRKLGRVDHGDAFLDTDVLERERGITIFSKQALLTLGETEIPQKTIKMVYSWEKDGDWTVNIETTGKNQLLRSVEGDARSVRQLYALVDALGFRSQWREA